MDLDTGAAKREMRCFGIYFIITLLALAMTKVLVKIDDRLIILGVIPIISIGIASYYLILSLLSEYYFRR